MASHRIDAVAAAFRETTQRSAHKSSSSKCGFARQDSLKSSSSLSSFTRQDSMGSVSSSMQPSFTKQDFLGGAKPLTLHFDLDPKHFKDSAVKAYGFFKSLGRYPVTFGEANAVAKPSCIAHFRGQPPSKTTFQRAKSFQVSVRAMPYEFTTGSFGWHCHQQHIVTIDGQKFVMNLNTNVPILASKAAHGSTLDDPMLDQINRAAVRQQHAAAVGTPTARGMELLKIPGIGPCVQERLRRVNITTPQQLQSMTPLMLEEVARSTGISAGGVMATIGDYVGIDIKAAPNDRAKVETMSSPTPSDCASLVVLPVVKPETERRRSWKSTLFYVPTSVKRIWQSITGQTAAPDLDQPAFEGPLAKRPKRESAHAADASSAAAASTRDASNAFFPQADITHSSSIGMEEKLHPSLLLGFQPEPANPGRIEKRAEADSEVKRILAARTSHILGNGSSDNQKQEFRRLLLLLHPDHGVVDKDDKNAALALQLCFAARKFIKQAASEIAVA